MKLLFRLFWLILTQSRRSRVDILGSATTQLRVWPNDLDIFLHVNNGVYLTYADLGRTDMMLRANAFHPIRKKGWYPVAAAASIQFRKSLKLWQTFTITTRVAGWDDMAVYIEQVFERQGKVYATALIDARFLSTRGERISTKQLFELLDMDDEERDIPEHVQTWIASNRAHREVTATPTDTASPSDSKR